MENFDSQFKYELGQLVAVYRPPNENKKALQLYGKIFERELYEKEVGNVVINYSVESNLGTHYRLKEEWVKPIKPVEEFL